jgi:nitroreductase / dihydropteridine reductase
MKQQVHEASTDAHLSQDYHFDSILKSAKLFEASYGLEPFRVLAVEDFLTKKKILRSLGSHQRNLQHARLVVIAVRPTITKSLINHFFDDLQAQKKTSRDSFSSYRKWMESSINFAGPDGSSWPQRQAMAALDVLQKASDKAGVTLKIIQEIDHSLVDDILDLQEEGLQTFALVSILQHKQGPDGSAAQKGAESKEVLENW